MANKKSTSLTDKDVRSILKEMNIPDRNAERLTSNILEALENAFRKEMSGGNRQAIVAMLKEAEGTAENISLGRNELFKRIKENVEFGDLSDIQQERALSRVVRTLSNNLGGVEDALSRPGEFIIFNYHGLEYDVDDIRPLLDGPSNLIGLIFMKDANDDTVADLETPFGIGKVALDLEASSFRLVNDVVYNNIRPTNFMSASLLSLADNVVSNTQLEVRPGMPVSGNFSHERIQYNNGNVSFSLFFRDELRAVMAYSNKIVLSGAAMNLGVMAYPSPVTDRGLFTTQVPTYKIEGDGQRDLVDTFRASISNVNLEIVENIGDRVLPFVEPEGGTGTPLFTEGIPCPPRWIGYTSAALGRYILQSSMLESLNSNGLLKYLSRTGLHKIRKSWNQFADKIIERDYSLSEPESTDRKSGNVKKRTKSNK